MQFGATGGFNLSFASAKEPGVVFHGSPGVRYAIGGFMDMALPNKNFSFRPSLLFSRESYAPVLYGDKTPIHISYINLPLTVIYHSSLMENHLFFGLGPYLAYALSGKYTNRGETTKIVWGSNPDKDDGKPLDIGLNLVAGYELQKNIILTAKFDLGIKQVAAETDVKVHTRNFGVTCGYFFMNK
jgi:Outer membrane protein beta-barrel domain